MQKLNNLDERINKLKKDLKFIDVDYVELDKRLTKLESDAFKEHEEMLYLNLKNLYENRNRVNHLVMNNLESAYEFVIRYGIPREEIIIMFNELTIEFVTKT